METRIFKSKKLSLIVIKNDNEERLTVSDAGIPYKDAGALIKSLGGVEEFWKHCHTQEEWNKIEDERKIFAEQRRIRRENEKKSRSKMIEKYRLDAKQAYDELISSNEKIEANYTNIYILLNHLQYVNWGFWELPKMSIGYSCNQYDCDGKTAVTIKLDRKIAIPYTDFSVEYCDKFVIGNPRGHLENYTRMVNPKYL